MQRLQCRPVSQLHALPKPVLPQAPRPVTAPCNSPMPAVEPASQRPSAADPRSTALERLGGALAHCSPALLVQLIAPEGAQAARVYLDVPDWLANFHLVDFLLNTPILTLGLLVLLLRLLPRVLKASVRYLLLPGTVVLVGWLAISHPQATAATIQAALEFVRDHPVASSLGMLALAALLLGPQLITGGLLLGGLLLLSAKTGLLHLPSLPSLPQLGAAPKTESPAGQGLVKRVQRLIGGAPDAPATSSSSSSSSRSSSRDGRGSKARDINADSSTDRVVTASSSNQDDASRGSWAQALPWLQQRAERLVHDVQGLGDRTTSLLPQQQAGSFMRGAQDLGSKLLPQQVTSLLPQLQQAEGSFMRGAQELGSKPLPQQQEAGGSFVHSAQEMCSRAQALLPQQVKGLGLSDVQHVGDRAQAFWEQRQQGLLGQPKRLAPAGGVDAAEAPGSSNISGSSSSRAGSEESQASRHVNDVLHNS